MKYKVHVFAVVRVPVEVEADNQIDAITEACVLENIDFHKVFDNVRGTDSEYAEELSHFLVDEIGDEQYSKSEWYEADGKTPMDRRTREAMLEEIQNSRLPAG